MHHTYIYIYMYIYTSIRYAVLDLHCILTWRYASLLASILGPDEHSDAYALTYNSSLTLGCTIRKHVCIITFSDMFDS